MKIISLKWEFNMIKKFIIIPLIIVVFIGHVRFLWSQETEEDDKNTNFNFGKNSFQFRISSNFTLTDFQGSLLSYKYHLTNKLAFRFGVGIGVEDNTYEDESLRISDDSIHISITSDYCISTADGLEWFFRKNMSLLAEYGFRFCYRDARNEKIFSQLSPPSTIIIEKSKSNGWIFSSESVRF